jgi:hypothetical protein
MTMQVGAALGFSIIRRAGAALLPRILFTLLNKIAP